MLPDGEEGQAEEAEGIVDSEARTDSSDPANRTGGEKMVCLFGAAL